LNLVLVLVQVQAWDQELDLVWGLVWGRAQVLVLGVAMKWGQRWVLELVEALV